MIIDGKKIAEEIKAELREKIMKRGSSPHLAILTVKPNEAIKLFIRLKENFGKAIGAEVKTFSFEKITEQELKDKIKELAETFDGIVVQLPLPRELMPVLEAIPPNKDVDGLSPLGRKNKAIFEPAVVLAIAEILKRFAPNWPEKQIAIVGQGYLVGAPLLDWFLKQGIKPTLYNRESDLSSLKKADIIISGTGKPFLIKKEMVKEGSLLIDAGTAEAEGKVVGDIDPACAGKAMLTPVPGGIGPITVAMLFRNLLVSSKQK